MGCGKSSVGRRLSELLCCRFVDLDEVAEEVAGKRVGEIFAVEGEVAFRDLELLSLNNILSKESARQWAPLAPSHFVGPSPYAGVRKCQFRTSVSSPEDETLVLALGGGAVMTPECAQIVKEQTCCIYLNASIETLMEHLSAEAEGRPLLQGEALLERITKLMELRSETYEKTAHMIIDIDGMTIEEISQEIYICQTK